MRFDITTYVPRLLLLLVCVALAIGCKKSSSTDPTPDPDIAAKVSGRYTITALTTTQTVTSYSGTAFIVRNGTSIDTVDLTLSYSTAGSSGSSSFTETKTLTLKAVGDNVDLYNGTTKVGTWTATELTLTNYPFNNSTVNVTATK